MLDRKYLGGVLAGAGLGFLVAQWIFTKTSFGIGGLWLLAAIAIGIGARLAHWGSKPTAASARMPP